MEGEVEERTAAGLNAGQLRDDAKLPCARYRFSATRNVKFFKDVSGVFLHGIDGDNKLIRDVAVAHARRDAAHDIQLALGQRVEFKGHPGYCPSFVIQRNRRQDIPTSDPKLATAFHSANALLQGEALSAALYELGIEHFGERGLAEIAALTGYYTMVAFTLRTFDIEPEVGAPQAFPRPNEALP